MNTNVTPTTPTGSVPSHSHSGNSPRDRPDGGAEPLRQKMEGSAFSVMGGVSADAAVVVECLTGGGCGELDLPIGGIRDLAAAADSNLDAGSNPSPGSANPSTNAKPNVKANPNATAANGSMEMEPPIGRIGSTPIPISPHGSGHVDRRVGPGGTSSGRRHAHAHHQAHGEGASRSKTRHRKKLHTPPSSPPTPTSISSLTKILLEAVFDSDSDSPTVASSEKRGPARIVKERSSWSFGSTGYNHKSALATPMKYPKQMHPAPQSNSRASGGMAGMDSSSSSDDGSSYDSSDSSLDSNGAFKYASSSSSSKKRRLVNRRRQGHSVPVTPTKPTSRRDMGSLHSPTKLPSASSQTPIKNTQNPVLFPPPPQHSPPRPTLDQSLKVSSTVVQPVKAPNQAANSTAHSTNSTTSTTEHSSHSSETGTNSSHRLGTASSTSNSFPASTNTSASNTSGNTEGTKPNSDTSRPETAAVTSSDKVPSTPSNSQKARYYRRKCLLDDWELKSNVVLNAFIYNIEGLPSEVICTFHSGYIRNDKFICRQTYEKVCVLANDLGLIIKKKGFLSSFRTTVPLTALSQISSSRRGDKAVVVCPEAGNAYVFSDIQPISVLAFITSIQSSIIQPGTITDKIIDSLEPLNGIIIGDSDIRPISFEAKGGYGEIWKGEYKGKHVAMKKLIGDKIRDKLIRHDFLREIILLRQLADEPNVITFFGLCTIHEAIWMITEWCPFGALHKVLFKEDYSTFPFSSKMTIMTNVCKGMASIHSKNVIHRDLKPENILVVNQETWQLKIADLGLSRICDNPGQTVTSGVQGTEGYSAPEQWQSHHTNKVDCFSWGIMAWEIMTGTRLSSKLNAETKAHPAVWKLQLRTLIQLPPNWPAAFRSMLLRCWSASPDDRPTFNEFLSVLPFSLD
ncbi:Serine/threonine-protein kinase HT1 [Pelomyxa schiedti]|nr:Serine/threonine-protein kinase HT1 [Pelomyxa schiedti]